MRVGFWSAVAGAVSGMVCSGVSKFLTSKVKMLTPMAVNGLSGMVETVAENAVLGIKTNLSDLRLDFTAITKGADGTWYHHEDGVTLQEIEILYDRFKHRGGISKLKK